MQQLLLEDGLTYHPCMLVLNHHMATMPCSKYTSPQRIRKDIHTTDLHSIRHASQAEETRDSGCGGGALLWLERESIE
jgi:hypothetical protein